LRGSFLRAIFSEVNSRPLPGCSGGAYSPTAASKASAGLVHQTLQFARPKTPRQNGTTPRPTPVALLERRRNGRGWEPPIPVKGPPPPCGRLGRTEVVAAWHAGLRR